MTSSPLCRKLQIKDGKSLILSGAPRGFVKALQPFPPGVRCSTAARGQADIILGFVRTRREARSGAVKWTRMLTDGGILWICYPKLTSGLAGELSRDVLWRELKPLGLRPVAMVSLDETWSAMRLKRTG